LENGAKKKEAPSRKKKENGRGRKGESKMNERENGNGVKKQKSPFRKKRRTEGGIKGN
jgi:hypothetical protein